MHAYLKYQKTTNEIITTRRTVTKVTINAIPPFPKLDAVNAKESNCNWMIVFVFKVYKSHNFLSVFKHNTNFTEHEMFLSAFVQYNKLIHRLQILLADLVEDGLYDT